MLNLVTINGRLSFSHDNGTEPINLNAKQVYIRAGELLIGNKTHPFEGDATITLHGDRKDSTQVMDGSVVTGNKLLLNTASMSMYGKRRSRASRLKASVYQGYDTAIVDAGLDWVEGDRIYFAPTNH